MKKNLSKVMMIFSIVVLLISHTGSTSFASTIENTEEFIELVKKSNYFSNYKNLLVTETPYILKEVTKEDSSLMASLSNMKLSIIISYKVKQN